MKANRWIADCWDFQKLSKFIKSHLQQLKQGLFLLGLKLCEELILNVQLIQILNQDVYVVNQKTKEKFSFSQIRGNSQVLFQNETKLKSKSVRLIFVQKAVLQFTSSKF